MSKKVFALALILLLNWPTARAQAQDVAPQDEAKAAARDDDKDKKESEDEKAKREALRKKAVALMEEVIQEIDGLKVPENRVRFDGTSADVLWKSDEKRARALFKTATNLLAELLKEQPVQPETVEGIHVLTSETEAYQQSVQAAQERAGLRSELLGLISRHDAKLAREFLLATRVKGRDDVQGRPENLPDRYLELNLAMQIASSDPTEALKIGEGSIKDGTLGQLPNLVSALASSDKDAARTLIDDLMRRLRSENLSKSGESMAAAMQLLMIALGGTVPKDGNEPSSATASLFDDVTIGQLANMVLDVVLAPSTKAKPTGDSDDEADDFDSDGMIAEMTNLLPAIQKYAPARAAALKARIDEVEKEMSPSERASADLVRIMQNGSSDEMVAAAQKAPQERRDDLYSQAAIVEMQKDNLDKALAIINDHVTDPARRKGLTQDINRRALWKAQEQGKLDEARALLARHPPDVQAMVLVNFANVAAGKGNKKLALQLLEEARGLLGPVPATSSQVTTMMSIASLYGSLDPKIAFEIIEPLVEQINTLLSALSVLDGFEYVRHFREGELVSRTSSPIVGLSFQCAQTLSMMARSDFDRAKAAADRFQRPELRMTARISIAQRILEDKETSGNDLPAGASLTRSAGFDAVTFTSGRWAARGGLVPIFFPSLWRSRVNSTNVTIVRH